MKRITCIIVVLAGILFPSTTNAQTGGIQIKPSKHYVTQDVKVKAFDGIVTTSSVDVVYTQAPGKPSVQIYAPDNLVEYIRVYVEDNQLKVGYKRVRGGLSINGENKTEVRVSSPDIHLLQTNSSGDIHLKNGLATTGKVMLKTQSSGDVTGNSISCSELHLSTHSSGDIELDNAVSEVFTACTHSSGDVDIKKVTATNVSATVGSSGDIELNKVICTTFKAAVRSSGDLEASDLKAIQVEASNSSSGDIKLSGQCKEAVYSNQSSGDVDAQKLKADRVTATIHSSGDIYCHATHSLTVKTNNRGEVYYKGNPATIEHTSARGLRKIN